MVRRLGSFPRLLVRDEASYEDDADADEGECGTHPAGHIRFCVTN